MTQVPEIDASDAEGRVDDGALVLDVREHDEWAAGRVDGSLHIPLGELGARQGEIPGDRALIVVCRSGPRSARATAVLVAADYDAVNLAGGLKAWERAGLPLVTDAGGGGTVA
jgi:rhodanese-related sulfurtransferase